MSTEHPASPRLLVEPIGRKLEYADQTRQMADLIDDLPKKVVATFDAANPDDRAARLENAVQMILVGLLPTIRWIVRNAHSAKAAVEVDRVERLLEEAVECCRLDIPEYAGGTIARVAAGLPSEAARERVAMMAFEAKLIAIGLREWADDIAVAESSEMFAKLTPDGSKLVRYLCGCEGMTSSIQAAMKHFGKRPASRTDTKSFRRLIQRTNNDLDVHYPSFEIDVPPRNSQMTLRQYFRPKARARDQ